MSIEDVAHNNPEKIFKLPIDLTKGLDEKDLVKAAKDLGLQEHQSQVIKIFRSLYQMFTEKDCDLIEINPLVLLKDGNVIAADSKVTVDDNAAFRQVEIAAEEDQS